MSKEKATEIVEEEGGENGRDSIIAQDISDEMRTSYLDYAMSVITARALPDIRDGLKPVHRRILYAMHEMGLTATAKFRKSAAVVGDVLGKYHPHGDSSVYDALANMAQDFSYRYPLIIGQGNFGSIDGDSPAAMRYTEAKMSRLSGDLLADLDKDTVDWRPNYDGTRKEPTVLPAALPNLLLNGTLGIAVGMATKIPPHNLGEVVDATMHLIDNPAATTEDLLEFVQGPDFPTGGIVFGGKDLAHAYGTGKGGIVVRAETDIIETKAGVFQIIVTSIPYKVNKAELLLKIADLHREKKLEGIKDLRDESTKDIRIVIELKAGAHPQKVLNYLYKHTQLEETFHFNSVALVDGVPQTLSLKGILEAFIGHRKIVVRRRTEYDLAKAKDREHILLGLKKALDHIDHIIKLIKASKDTPTAHASLMKEFKFSERQATAILEMRLSKLAGLERKKIEDELAEVQALIAKLETILGSEKKILTVVKDELAAARERHADERKTKITRDAAKAFSVEDVIPDEESLLVLSAGGYVKRINPSEYRSQKRGGVGVIDLETKEEDFITTFLSTSTHSDLLFFTDKGKAYQIKMYDVPEGRRATRGKSIMNFLSIGNDEKVTSVLPMPKSAKASKLAIAMITKQGVIKKSAAESFHDVRRSGLIALRLEAGDELVSTLFVAEGDDIILTTAGGQSIRFKESDAREMGRSAAGVAAMRLDEGDVIVGASVIPKGSKDLELLVVSANGYGKRTPVSEYKVQKRAGSGIKTAKVTAKTGNIIISRIIGAEESEIVAISQKSKVIRAPLTDIPSLGRQTQGVRIMKLKDGDSIASFVCM
jgi:DNA gyrase subunit A